MSSNSSILSITSQYCKYFSLAQRLTKYTSLKSIIFRSLVSNSACSLDVSFFLLLSRPYLESSISSN
ncbi:unnamed protein product [Meloidogyne enterolobii]|uniref:Uncharacterized protein n=1 Tax=Meloidogyne enterolobii TaxID=390850 RepID=A0ACB0ZFA9_MELEN